MKKIPLILFITSYIPALIILFGDFNVDINYDLLSLQIAFIVTALVANYLLKNDN